MDLAFMESWVQTEEASDPSLSAAESLAHFAGLVITAEESAQVELSTEEKEMQTDLTLIAEENPACLADLVTTAERPVLEGPSTEGSETQAEAQWGGDNTTATFGTLQPFLWAVSSQSDHMMSDAAVTPHNSVAST